LSVLKRLVRLIALVSSASVLVAGTVIAVGAVASRAYHGSAVAQEIPLPPLTSQFQLATTIYAADHKTVLAVLRGPELREPVALSQVSKVMVTAVLDTEDHGFYVHGGFDLRSIARAAVHDASGSGLQGGSTIAQQLVKQVFLTPSQTLSRKVREVVLADRLEREYSRNTILETYLNTIYLGNGAYGVQAAAQTYFSEPASALNLAQAALLAGMIQDPNGYDPILNPAAARVRRSEVLARMVYYKDITPAQAAAANLVPLPGAKPPPPSLTGTNNYYVLQVKNELLGPGSPLGSTYAERYAALFEGGLKVYTNMDPTAEADAESAVAANTPANSVGYEEGLVSINPANGAVEALVGGSGSAASQFDVMTQAQRQPGSGFKIFTLLAALEQGYSVYDTVDSQSPCYISFPGNNSLLTKPINNDTGAGGGVISVVDATANSVNCAYMRLARQIGLPNVVSMAQRMGVSEVTAADAFIPSMVIGAIAVHPIEMADAYATLADGGVYHPPSFISTIVDRTGAVIYHGDQPGKRIFSSQIAAEADVAFQAVVQYGTGTAAALGNRPVAGKTGTTSNNVDAWFNGFTPQLATSVWMGALKGEIPIVIDGLTVYGANYPASTWHDYSAAVLANQPVLDFPTPDGALVPPSKYVTSPALVAADVRDHNYVAPPAPPPTYAPATTTPSTSTPTTATPGPPDSTPPASGTGSTGTPPAPAGAGSQAGSQPAA
jgi:penicillin-binding protein 1A